LYNEETDTEEEWKNVSQKYNSFTKVFFRYREPVIGNKEKKDKGIRGIQFLSIDIQEDRRGEIYRIIF